MEAVHFVADFGPGLTGLMLSHPHEEQRKPTQEHMRPYPVILAVIHRAQRQCAFQGPESTLYFIELFIA
jgi:hypothetical protein